MKQTPLYIYSDSPIEAILNGQKTQFRQAISGVAKQWLYGYLYTPEYVAHPDNDLCPYGKVGDIIYVLETFNHIKLIDFDFNDNIKEQVYGYVFRAGDVVFNKLNRWSWNNARHMPKEACRIYLKIKSIRIEKFLDISEEDAKSEGVSLVKSDGKKFKTYKEAYMSCVKHMFSEEFFKTQIWAWVIEFERTEKPTV